MSNSKLSTMSVLVDVLSVLLLLAAAAAFCFGVRALTTEEDLVALYLLLVGALSLRAATDLLRPKSSPS